MQHRKNSSLYRNNAWMLSIVFFVCLVGAPSINYQTRYNAVTDSVGKWPLTIGQSSEAYLTSESFINEILSNMEISYLTNRNLQSYQKMLLRTLNILLSIAGYYVLLHCIGHVKRKRTKNIPIMALSIGGHAPPFVIS